MISRMTIVVVCLCLIAGLKTEAAAGQSCRSIREVDFRNFTYQPGVCHKEFSDIGIGRSVKVKKGVFQVEDMGLGGGEFSVGPVVYGDLNGDGAEEAVVVADCGSQSANYRRSELYLYSLKSGRPVLVATVNYSDFNNEYKKQFRFKYDAFNYIVKNGVKIKDGVLVLEWTAEGQQVEPEYFVTMKYGMKGNSLHLAEKPERRQCNSRCSWEKGLPQ